MENAWMQRVIRFRGEHLTDEISRDGSSMTFLSAPRYGRASFEKKKKNKVEIRFREKEKKGISREKTSLRRRILEDEE